MADCPRPLQFGDDSEASFFNDPAWSASRSLEAIEHEIALLKLALLGQVVLPEGEMALPDGQHGKELGIGSEYNEVHLIADKRLSLPDPNLLEKISRNRRKRREFFGDRLFEDPAWDMILDLAMARARFQRVAVTSLCIASGVPATTALRWISVLINRGVFQREDDVTDKRRAFISLTDAGAHKVARYFASIETSQLAL